MLYVFTGTENVKIREKSSKLAELLLARKPGARLFSLSGERFDEPAFEEYLVGSTLFVDKFIILCDDLLTGKQSKEKVLDYIPVMVESANVFILRENELDPKIIKTLEKSGAKLEKMGKKEKEIFSYDLSNAVVARDRKRAWMIYEQKLMSGEESEGLFWQIWGGVKKALYVKKAGAKSGLSPAAVSMTLRQSAKYTTEEIELLAGRLFDLFHSVRRGEGELDAGIERVLLEL